MDALGRSTQDAAEMDRVSRGRHERGSAENDRGSVDGGRVLTTRRIIDSADPALRMRDLGLDFVEAAR